MVFEVKVRTSSFAAFIQEQATTIGRGGMFIATDDPKPVGSLVNFEFTLGESDACLVSGSAEVRWARHVDACEPGQKAGMGVEFVNLDGDSLALIDRIVGVHEPRGTVSRSEGAAEIFQDVDENELLAGLGDDDAVGADIDASGPPAGEGLRFSNTPRETEIDEALSRIFADEPEFDEDAALALATDTDKFDTKLGPLGGGRAGLEPAAAFELHAESGVDEKTEESGAVGSMALPNEPSSDSFEEQVEEALEQRIRERTVSAEERYEEEVHAAVDQQLKPLVDEAPATPPEEAGSPGEELAEDRPSGEEPVVEEQVLDADAGAFSFFDDEVTTRDASAEGAGSEGAPAYAEPPYAAPSMLDEPAPAALSEAGALEDDGGDADFEFFDFVESDPRIAAAFADEPAAAVPPSQPEAEGEELVIPLAPPPELRETPPPVAAPTRAAPPDRGAPRAVRRPARASAVSDLDSSLEASLAALLNDGAPGPSTSAARAPVQEKLPLEPEGIEAAPPRPQQASTSKASRPPAAPAPRKGVGWTGRLLVLLGIGLVAAAATVYLNRPVVPPGDSPTPIISPPVTEPPDVPPSPEPTSIVVEPTVSDEPPIVATATPEPEATPEPTAPSKPDRRSSRITAIDVTSEGGAFVLRIEGDGNSTPYKSMTLEDPMRYVVDVLDVTTEERRATIPVDSPLVSRVRLGKYPDKVRLVLDVNGAPEMRVDEAEGVIQIWLQ